MIPIGFTLLTVLIASSLAGAPEESGSEFGVLRVTAQPEKLRLTMRAPPGGIGIAEVQPFQKSTAISEVPLLLRTNKAGEFIVEVTRFDGVRDRLYSGFAASRVSATVREPVGAIHFVEELESISRYLTAHPTPPSKKGLQVQMVDDALALGIKHCAVNLNLAGLVQLVPQAESLRWEMDGQTYWFNRRYLESLPIQRLSEAGVVVNLIVLYYTGRTDLDRVMAHPNSIASAPNKLVAFNTLTPDGLRYFKAAMEFLADRYSRSDVAHGRVWGYIIGNEVNAHWEWYNLGPATPGEVVDDYLRSVRVAHTAIRKASAHARVYLSLTHYWTQLHGNNPQRACGGKELIDEFATRARAGGDFDWHLAHHPYPENLFEPRVWLDKTPTSREDTPKITFKNLEVLDAYFRRPELQYRGTARRIILSEQGFNCPNKADGELWQAAAYCYAWKKVELLAGIDALILHRHVDHRGEGGLNLGLWSRQSESVATPDKPRKMQDVFRVADRPEWEDAFRFALPVLGITNWVQVLQKP